METKTLPLADDSFLEQLESEPLPVAALTDAIFALLAKDGPERAQAWLDLLADKLADTGQGEAVIALWKSWCECTEETSATRHACMTSLKKAFDSKREPDRLEHAGFDKSIPLAEALRRLETLAALKPGTLCHKDAWGFGMVVGVDDFYGKLVVDFDRKRGHEMTLSYAAEALEMIGPDHLLARHHADPDALAALVAKDPAETVRIALRSFGPMNAAALQERLCDGIVEPSDWKRFWDMARKTLKNDKRVRMPARRADRIEILSQEQRYDATWFAELSACSDMDRIHELLTELLDACDRQDWTRTEQETLIERLGFAMTGAESRRRDLMARFAVQAVRLGLDPATIGNGLLDRFFSSDFLLPALAGLPAKELNPFLDLFRRRNPDQADPLLLDALAVTTNQAVNAIAALFETAGKHETLAAHLRVLLAREEPAPVVLAWIARHAKRIADWRLASPQEFLALLVACLQTRQSGEALKAQNQIRGLMEKETWLGRLLEAMPTEALRDTLKRVREAEDWDIGSRREVMALMIRHEPALERDMSEQADSAPVETAAQRFTSLRSYRERARQYKRLLEQEIPANSRDIAVARSYGDLRENAEYESAKMQQGLLMSRKAEWEQDLTNVRETDFAGRPTDRAGMGTRVVVETDNGQTREYCLLGEWDRDEELNIVSSQSLVAKKLEGKRPGDPVLLPGDPHGITGRIAEVGPLPEHVRAWLTDAG